MPSAFVDDVSVANCLGREREGLIELRARFEAYGGTRIVGGLSAREPRPRDRVKMTVRSRRRVCRRGGRPKAGTCSMIDAYTWSAVAGNQLVASETPNTPSGDRDQVFTTYRLI